MGMRQAPTMDLLYLGTGTTFESPGPYGGLLPKNGKCAGVTQIGYTWCAHAIGYSRQALTDVLSMRMPELLWSHDDAIPHLYCRRPWNDRFVKALHASGWQRRVWIAGAPSDCYHCDGSDNEDWINQLEFCGDQGVVSSLGTAAASSNSGEF